MARRPGRLALWVVALFEIGAPSACTTSGAAGRASADASTEVPTDDAMSAGGAAGSMAPGVGGAGGGPAVAPTMGDGFAICVNGAAVTIRSTTESGGFAPDIPTLSTRATKRVPPLSGGTLLALADGTTLVASDPERDQIYVIDTRLNTVVATIPLQDGDEPGRLAEDAAGRVHVVLRRGGALATIAISGETAGKTATISARRAICSAPRGVAFQKDTGDVHVACAGGELVSLPAAGGAATRTVMLDSDLRDVVVGADGSLLVSSFRKAEVLVVGIDGKVVARLRPASGTVPTTSLMRATETRTPSVAWRMVPWDPGTNSVFLLHQTGITDIVDTVPGGYTGMSDCGGIVQPGLSLLAPGRTNPPVATGLGALTLAIDIAVSPDHQKVAFAVAGNSPAQGPTVVEEAIDVAMPPVPVPCGIGTSDIARPLPPGQAVAVSYSSTGVLFAQVREPAAIWRADTGATISLAGDARADTGHLVFHANSGGGLACASCHPEGAEDGRVWNFVCTGARRTQSLSGGIGPTVPFHWDGSESDLAHLVDDVFSGRMAGPLLSDDQKTALAGWLDTIPAPASPAGLDASSIVRGKALFDDVKIGCATCHSGPLLTNNATVDVGTGTAFQVPSLRGISARAPFMHNGCAATLADRFASLSCGGGDKHGVTSALTAAQIDDLVAYTSSL